jgi:hypothetical protein
VKAPESALTIQESGALHKRKPSPAANLDVRIAVAGICRWSGRVARAPRRTREVERSMPIETASGSLQRRPFDIKAAVLYLRQLGAEGATVNFIRNLISRSEVPHVKIGKKFYLSRDGLDRWITNHERRN